jgi:hypothetical protein
MKSIHTLIKNFAVAFGIVAGFVILTAIGALIVSAPEEAGLLMTIVGLICASVSMLLITFDLPALKKRVGFRRWDRHAAR